MHNIFTHIDAVYLGLVTGSYQNFAVIQHCLFVEWKLAVSGHNCH